MQAAILRRYRCRCRYGPPGQLQSIDNSRRGRVEYCYDPAGRLLRKLRESHTRKKTAVGKIDIVGSKYGNSRTILKRRYMNFEVIHVSRGDIRLKSEGKYVRVSGEALIASTPTEPSYVIYLNSLHNWEVTPDVALTETEKQDVVSAIWKHFQDRGSVVEFEW